MNTTLGRLVSCPKVIRLDVKTVAKQIMVSMNFILCSFQCPRFKGARYRRIVTGAENDGELGKSIGLASAKTSWGEKQKNGPNRKAKWAVSLMGIGVESNEEIRLLLELLGCLAAIQNDAGVHFERIDFAL